VKLWLDAQLSPRLARWVGERFDVDVTCVRDLGLRDAEDEDTSALKLLAKRHEGTRRGAEAARLAALLQLE
jgi:predicted nuclease of predicted toxin-antitoxin system